MHAGVTSVKSVQWHQLLSAMQLAYAGARPHDAFIWSFIDEFDTDVHNQSFDTCSPTHHFAVCCKAIYTCGL